MTKNKRIGIDARMMYQTGVGVYIRNILFHLLQTTPEGVTYVVFARSEDWDRLKTEYAIAPRATEFVHSTALWHSFSEQIIFLWQLIVARLDVVHFPYFSWPVLYFRPFVATIHDTILLTHATGRASTLSPLWYKTKQLVFRWVIAEQAHRARTILVPSESVRQEVVKVFPLIASKTLVTHEGVDALFARTAVEQPRDFPYKTKQYFLYVGNCYPHKNVDVLLAAFAELVKTHPDARLVLVGPDSVFAHTLKKSAQSMQSHSLWKHDVQVAELKWLYTHARSLVFPSKAEGFGLPILEAHSCGCHTILSDISVFHEVAGSRARYVVTGDSSDLCRAMQESMVQDTPVQDMKINPHFSFETLAAETQKIY